MFSDGVDDFDFVLCLCLIILFFGNNLINLGKFVLKKS